MTEAPTRRGVLVVLAVGIVALICLLLGYRSLKGRVEDQKSKSASSSPPIPDTAGVAGSVAFGDGTAAGGVRVSISWKDSAGRAGNTIALTGPDGVFAQNKVPWDAQVTEVRAESGPLAASADAGSLASRDSGGPRVRVRLPGEFALAGLVRRAGDRAPVAGATFEVAGARATSSSGGGFKIERIPWSVLREERPVVRIRAQGLADLDWPLPLDAPPESYADLTILMEPSK